MLQTELEQRLAWDHDLFALLDYGPYRAGSYADGCSHPSISRNASDYRAEARSAQKTLGASLAAAAPFHLIVAGEKRIGSAADNDVREFELQLGCLGSGAVPKLR